MSTTESGPGNKAATTLWFVAHGDRTTALAPDPGEFRSIDWFDLAATDWAAGRFDPHMARFISKLGHS